MFSANIDCELVHYLKFYLLLVGSFLALKAVGQSKAIQLSSGIYFQDHLDQISEVSLERNGKSGMEAIEVHFTLRNTTTDKYEWAIDFKKNDYVSVRVFDEHNALLEQDTAGYLVPGSLKKLGRGNASIYVIPPDKVRRFEVILYKGPHLINSSLQISPMHDWLDRLRVKLAMDIGFVAITFIFGLYNLIFFIQSRRNSYFYLGGYLTIVALFFGFASLLFRDYLFNEFPIFTLYFIVIALFAPFFHWRFVQSLVPTRSLIPTMNTVMNIVVYGCIGLAVIQGIMFLAGLPYKSVSGLTRLGILVNVFGSLIAYILLLLKKDKITNYFLVGTLMMLVGVAYDAWYWDMKDGLSYVSRAGFIVEVLFFSLGLGKRIQLDTEENQHNLELLVEKRTQALNQQRNFFERVLNDVNSLVFVRDEDANIVFCNEEYADLYDTKPENLIGKNLKEVTNDLPGFYEKVIAEDREIMNHAFADKAFVFEEASLKNPNIWMRVSKKRVVIDGVPYLLGLLVDISNLKKTEKKLQRANNELKQKMEDLQSAEGKLIEFEKMASIGQLTSGLAHEIGNPVNYLAGNVQPLEADLKEMEQLVEMVEHNRSYLQNSIKGKEMLKFFDDVDFHYTIKEIKELMQGIEHGSARVKALVESFRDFSRADSDIMVHSDLNKAMISTIRLIEHAIRGRINLEVNLDEDLPEVQCSMGQVSQVFLNLINNAIQSIKDEGLITITSYFDDSSIYFDITDTGSGIPGNKLKKIFEPFFTTKEVGKGTGLGLSMSRNIISRHRGVISVKSKLEVGSTFTIKLPR